MTKEAAVLVGKAERSTLCRGNRRAAGGLLSGFARGGSVAAFLAVTVAGGSAAQASDAADRCQRNVSCRVHSDRGVAFSEKKKYAEALAEFQAAYAAEPMPRLLLNIGRSLYRLDRPTEALDYYARFRKEETSLDAEAEQTLRKYEIDALMAQAASEQGEPKPAPLANQSTWPSRLPPRVTLGLLGASVGLFILGIGLGAGAASAGGELSQPGANFMTFGPAEKSIETRGLNLQAAGITFDILGLVSLSAGGASLATWLYMKKKAPSLGALAVEHRARARALPLVSVDQIAYSLGGY